MANLSRTKLTAGSLVLLASTTASMALPDVVLCELYSLSQFGTSGSVRALALATTSWNIGDSDLPWMQNPDPQHPVIGMNMYRLDNDRFEQIGVSWLKHGFFALGDLQCDDSGLPNCVYESGHGIGDYLGQGCTDTYSASLNAGGLGPRFQENVARMNELLAERDATLMPTAMHPWMRPETDLVLWHAEDREIYETFDRIFQCTGHGWSNLQSVHLNLPFRDDREFARLSAAIRLVLPILPALAASSPLVEGRPSGFLDTRMELYRSNARRVPSVSGLVIPEPVWSRAAYELEILGRIYADLAPADPRGVLRHEWVNARGSIARFDRGAIEIRIVDIQECPAADVAIATAIVSVLEALVREDTIPLEDQMAWDTAPLALLLLDTIRNGDRAVLHDTAYLEALGFDGPVGATAGELWAHLVDRFTSLAPNYEEVEAPLACILEHGCLSRRILERLGGEPTQPAIARVYRTLVECLAEGRSFEDDGR